MEQDGTLVALALAAFSVPWPAPEIAELAMPEVAPPDPERKPGAVRGGAGVHAPDRAAAAHRREAIHRLGRSRWRSAAGSASPQPRPIDTLSLAFFTDALFSPPFMRLTEPSTTPTIDLTIHFRTPMPRVADPDPDELCFARFRSGLIHEGFFEEDGVIWASDGTVLAQSRQLGIVMPRPIG